MPTKSMIFSCVFIISESLWPAMAQADVIEERLAQYRNEGAVAFDANQGQTLWKMGHQGRRCTQCHGEAPNTAGKHIKTGKVIEPMALSINPNRFADADKIEKWFLRNCKWTLGRVCTPQEKGNILVWLRGQ